MKDSIEKAAQHFGGIDIVVNNASAINLQGTLAISMKKYDLMHSINTRCGPKWFFFFLPIGLLEYFLSFFILGSFFNLK